MKKMPLKIIDVFFYLVKGFKFAKKIDKSFTVRLQICGMQFLLCASIFILKMGNISGDVLFYYLCMSVVFIPFFISIIIDICWYAINDTVNRYTLEPHAVSDNVKKNISRVRTVMVFAMVLSVFVSIAIILYSMFTGSKFFD